MKLKKRILSALLTAVMLISVMPNGFFTVASAATVYPEELVNGDFSYPANLLSSDMKWAIINPSSATYGQSNDATEPNRLNNFSAVSFGWNRTELQRDNKTGNVYGELCAGTSDSAIYQDIATVPGAIYYWELKFSSRSSSYLDQMSVIIGTPAAQTAQIATRLTTNGIVMNANGDTNQTGYQSTVISTPSANSASNNGWNHEADWEKFSGTYTVPAGQTVTRFTFKAVSWIRASVGCAIDEVRFSVAYPLTYHTDTGTAPGIGYYAKNVSVTLAGKTDSMSREGYQFAGWSYSVPSSGNDWLCGTLTEANGKIIPGLTKQAKAEDVYAVWVRSTAYSVVANYYTSTDGKAYAPDGTVTKTVSTETAVGTQISVTEGTDWNVYGNNTYVLDPSKSVMSGTAAADPADNVLTLSYYRSVTHYSVVANYYTSTDGKAYAPDGTVTKTVSAETAVGTQISVTEGTGWNVYGNNTYVLDPSKSVMSKPAETDPAQNTLTVNYYRDLITYTVTKAWDDANDQDGARPDSITVHLLADGADTKQTAELSEQNGWKASFTGLALYAAGKPGTKISYTVSEDALSSYTAKIVYTDNSAAITNSHAPDAASFDVEKVWSDANDQDGVRPAGITVHLLANGTAVKTVTLNAAGGWKATFTDLPANSTGKAIKYTVAEDPVEGYTSGVVYNNAGTFTVTNTHTPAATSVSVIKVWDDAGSAARPESVTVQLSADGKTSGNAVVLNAENNWTYIWTDLAKNANGKEISYTVAETAVPVGYTAVVSSDGTAWVITNTLTPVVIPVPLIPGGSTPTTLPDSPDVPLGNAPVLAETSGSRGTLFGIIGLTMMAVGAVVGLKKKRNGEEQ